MKHISRYHISAGGVLYNSATKKIALIHFAKNLQHAELYALPKGHVDPGETPRQAASREIKEETGYVDITPVAKIGTMQFTYQHFKRNNEWNHKIVHIYLFFLKSPKRDHTLRQAYERHTVAWRTFDEALKLVRYENARRMIIKAQRLLSTNRPE